MAKKSIILSNNSGSTYIPNTSSAWFEDSTQKININKIIADSLKIETETNGLIKISSGGTPSIITANAVVGGTLRWNGTEWISSDTALSSYSGNAGGDFSGSYSGDVVLTNISNIVSGTLSTTAGGFGISLPNNSKIIPKLRNGIVTGITASSAMSGSFLVNDTNGFFSLSKPNHVPDVRFYKVGTYTWTKPKGAKFVKVCCQGAGSGGSGGHSWNGGIHYGSGGGSGGYSEKTYNAVNLPDTVTVTVGAGGVGGAGNPTNGAVVWLGTGDSNASVGCSIGAAGGNSSFGSYLVAYGGGATSFAWIAGGAGGVGTLFNGSAGAFNAGTICGAGGNTNNSAGGGTGGANGGPITLSGIYSAATARRFLFTVDSAGNTIDATFGVGATGVNWNGASTQKPAKPTYGAGGAGGIAQSNTGQSAGGDGGDGYVLVISWF